MDRAQQEAEDPVTLMERQWKNLECGQGDFRVRVLHWNVLAQKLTDGFDKTDEKFVTWEHRKPLFEQEFFKKREDGSLFWDIVCIAECDEHNAFFGDIETWVGHYGGKPNSFTGGTAIYANAAKFEVQKVECENFFDEEEDKPMTQNWVSLTLKHKETEQQFVVIGTHLKAKPDFAAVRVVQCKQLVKLLERYAGMEVILVGDMNDTPDSECVGILNAAFDSSNKVVFDGEEPPFTTHKFRPKEGMVTRTIDYIFSQNKEAREKAKEAGNATIIGHSGTYQLPTQEELPETGYPT